jgi:molecular chaperone GrpE
LPDDDTADVLDPSAGARLPTSSEAQDSAREEVLGLSPAIEAPPESDPVEAFHQRARLAEGRLAEVMGAYRELKKETEAYRERFTRNVERRYDQRRERLLLKFIEILDNLDRALEAAETTYAGEPLIAGLILVRTQLLQTLQEEGLERIPVLGLPYDPNFSEAVETRPVEDPDHHHVVVKEMMRGYRLNGRIARASRVVVGEYAGEIPAAEVPEPEAPATIPPAPAEAAPPAVAEEPPAPAETGPSLEDIVSRAEAQEALFPGAFEDQPPRRSEEDDE